LGSAFSTGISDNNATATTNTGATAGSDLALALAAGGKQTVSDSQLSSLANTLYNTMSVMNSGYSTPDPGPLIEAVETVQTNVDWLRLVQLFGARSFNTGGMFSLCSWVALGCTNLDLGSALKMALGDNVTSLNTYFSNSGINVQI
jgi:hypothetical protein